MNNHTSATMQETQIIITMADSSLARSIRSLLKHIPGILSIKTKTVATKSEIEKALEEAHSGKVTHYDSIDDFFKEMEA